VTREKTLAGHVSAFEGILRDTARDGSKTLNPDTKYSATNMDPKREKQKPSSTHIVLKASGRSLPRRSISEGVYDACGGDASSALVESAMARKK